MRRVGAVVRQATASDLPALAQLGGELCRVHHAFDARRFFLPVNVEAGYEGFFRHEMSNQDVVILAAVQDEKIVGYAYGRLEPRDWNNLLDDHGAVHDLYVLPAARRRGVARDLVSTMLEWFRARGAKRVVLYAASPNSGAQRLFEALGFRSTMVEMTRELG